MESQTTFRIPERIVFRKVDERLVVIDLSNGGILYYSADSESFFDFFRRGGTLDDYCLRAEVTDLAERQYLQKFVQDLKSEGLLEVENSSVSASQNVASYLRPAFLEKDPRKLDEISFACP